MNLSEYLFLNKQKELNDFRKAEKLVMEELQNENLTVDMDDFNLLITAALFISKDAEQVTKYVQDNVEHQNLSVLKNLENENGIEESVARLYIKEVLKTVLKQG